MNVHDLADREFGGPEAAPAVLFLHGLLGSSRNWMRIGKLMSERFRPYALDLRNHGDSPEDTWMDYPAMAADVLHWLDKAGLEQAHIVGHSMGGKVAMYLVCHYPERFSSLTVVDIAPRAYPPRWEKEFAVMRRMPVHHFTKRQEAEDWLAEDIRDWAFRKFLVSNLERAEGGGFQWAVNLRILEAALPNLFQQIPKNGERYDGPVLFLRGEKSRFVADHDAAMIREFFPEMKLVTVADAGHNVHFNQPEAFVTNLAEHLS